MQDSGDNAVASIGGNLRRLASLRSVFAKTRRYPLIPLTVLLLVLIIPAVFADLIAPHHHLDVDPARRLQPPGWVEPKVLTKTVVERVEARDTEISQAAARSLRPGDGLGQSPNLPEEVMVGDEVQIITGVGGSWSRPLGTDKLGRDIVSRLIHGSRLSLIVALLVIVTSGVLGTSLGLIAGYYRGWVDFLVSRAVDFFLAIPPLLIALVLVLVYRTSLWIVVIVIAVQLWAVYARMVRGETLTLMEQGYIDRARVAGASGARIIMRHLFPNLVNSLIVLSTLQIGFVIIFESALSFLGVGIPSPAPSWGSIVADGRDLIIQTGWWVSIFSGAAIALTVLSANLLGDWLRDELDPKLKHL